MAEETLNDYLERAGCTEEMRETVNRLARAGHACEALPLLAEQRLGLLEQSRKACARLDSIDTAIRIITRGHTNAHECR